MLKMQTNKCQQYTSVQIETGRRKSKQILDNLRNLVRNLEKNNSLGQEREMGENNFTNFLERTN